jgi:predicted transcriptional regulator
MTKLLEKAIAKVRELPEDEQDALAAALLAMTGEEPPTIRLDEVTRAAVREGLAEAERGEFVADEIVAEADKRHDV